MHTHVEVRAGTCLHRARSPDVSSPDAVTFHGPLIYSLQGYVSVYSVPGPGDTVTKVDLGAPCPGVARACPHPRLTGSSQQPHKGGSVRMMNVPTLHTRKQVQKDQEVWSARCPWV